MQGYQSVEWTHNSSVDIGPAVNDWTYSNSNPILLSIWILVTLQKKNTLCMQVGKLRCGKCFCSEERRWCEEETVHQVCMVSLVALAGLSVVVPNGILAQTDKSLTILMTQRCDIGPAINN